MEIAKKTNAEIINLYNPFLKKSDLFPDGIHPNTEGLGIMAIEVAKALK
jgi:lysophospholipase L1-like esterase